MKMLVSCSVSTESCMEGYEREIRKVISERQWKGKMSARISEEKLRKPLLKRVSFLLF